MDKIKVWATDHDHSTTYHASPNSLYGGFPLIEEFANALKIYFVDHPRVKAKSHVGTMRSNISRVFNESEKNLLRTLLGADLYDERFPSSPP